MYCENCQFEIEDHQETQCPLCGGPLSPSSEVPGGIAGSISPDADDATRGTFILEDDDDDDAMEPESLEDQAPLAFNHQELAAPGPLAFNNQEMPPVEPAYPVQDEPDFAESTEMLDQALEEFDPMVDEHFKNKKKSKSSSTLLLTLLLFCVLGAAGYYYFFMMGEPEVPAPAVPARVVQPKKKAAPVAKPAAPAENPIAPVAKPMAPAEKPAAPAAAPAAETKEPAPAKPAQEVKKPEAPVAAPAVKAETKSQEPTPAAPEPEKAVMPAQTVPAPEADSAEPAEVKKPAKEAQPAAAPQAPAVKAGQPVFSVMLASFRSRKNADKEVQRLRKLGYDARIMRIDLGRKGVYNRVLVGAWPSRFEAQDKADELRSKLGRPDASIIPVMQ